MHVTSVNESKQSQSLTPSAAGRIEQRPAPRPRGNNSCYDRLLASLRGRVSRTLICAALSGIIASVWTRSGWPLLMVLPACLNLKLRREELQSRLRVETAQQIHGFWLATGVSFPADLWDRHVTVCEAHGRRHYILGGKRNSELLAWEVRILKSLSECRRFSYFCTEPEGSTEEYCRSRGLPSIRSVYSLTESAPIRLFACLQRTFSAAPESVRRQSRLFYRMEDENTAVRRFFFEFAERSRYWDDVANGAEDSIRTAMRSLAASVQRGETVTISAEMWRQISRALALRLFEFQHLPAEFMAYREGLLAPLFSAPTADNSGALAQAYALSYKLLMHCVYKMYVRKIRAKCAEMDDRKPMVIRLFSSNVEERKLFARALTSG